MKATVAAALFLLAGALQATVVRLVSLEEAIALSDAIVRGTVLSSEAREDASGRVITDVRVEVEECLKGALERGSLVEIRVLGGQVGERWVRVEGEAVYRVGSEVLLHLERVADSWVTLGLAFGKWDVEWEGERDFLVRNLAGLTPVDGESTVERSISFGEFKERVSRAASRQGRER